jgi:hypothetical protein
MELKKLNRQNPGGGRHRFGDLGADVEMSLKLLVTESDYEGVKWAALTECRDHTGFFWTRGSVNDG